MAYLGPPPSQKLATPTSQYFSGNGSATAFTLNRPVNVAEDLNVFVNNVPQEPGSGKSYTATGTTLTFDAAPASGTNNVYVVYRGLAEPTTRLEHPSGQPLAATTGTFSGNVTAGELTVNTSDQVLINHSADGGGIRIDSTNATNTGSLRFGDTADNYIGAVEYNHSTDALSFYANNSTRMTINSSGNAGIGTVSPSARLQVETTANSPVLFKSTNVNGGYVEYSLGGNGATVGYLGSANALVSTGAVFGSPSNTDLCIRTQNNLVFSIGTTEHMRMTSAGYLHLLSMPNSAGNADLRFSTSNGAVSFDTSSRLVKENIVDCPYGLAEVTQLQPRKYLRTDDQVQEVGFIADEVSEILPEFVPMMKRSVFTKNDEDTDLVAGSVNYSKLTAVLTKAIQEQQATIKALEARITALESK